MRRAPRQRVAQQRAGLLHVAAIERIEALVDQGFGLALPLGLRAPRALDVGASAIVMAIEEQDARPEIDGGVELAGEVVIEPRDEQVLDAHVLSGGAGRLSRGRDGRQRLGHG